MSGERGGADARLLRRATAVIAAQTALAVAVVVAAVAALVLFLTMREQQVDAERIVRTAAQSAQDVNDAPPQAVLIIRDQDGRTQYSSGTRPGLRSVDVGALPAGAGEVSTPPDGHHDDITTYQVYVVDRPGRRVVAALDGRYRHYETERLLTSLLLAGLVGIVAAAGVGWLTGRRAVRPLSEALGAQRRFVADASHELRTPLTILHTRAQLAARRPGLDERTRQELQQLVSDSRVLSEIVSDLLLSAQAQHRPDTREPVDLTLLAREVAASFEASAQQAGVTVTVQVPGQPCVIDGVGAALRRAVNALIDNALAHTGPGGTVTIRVAHGTGVSLSVADDGEGFDPAEVPRLTERFARGSGTVDQGRRFGLGLALVREVVQAHGGVLTLDGRVGAGATATITLPARR